METLGQKAILFYFVCFFFLLKFYLNEVLCVVYWDIILTSKYFLLEAFDCAVFRLSFEKENWAKVQKVRH